MAPATLVEPRTSPGRVDVALRSPRVSVTRATSPLTVTACIPARNEEPTIGDVIERTMPFVDEVVVVDGWSTDGTRDVAEALGARVVRDTGEGKGAALRTGARAARGEIVVFLDADGSHDPGDIPTMVAPIQAHEADLVIGSRGRGGSDELHGDLEKLLRLVGSNLILIGINSRFHVNLTDSQNGFRAIRRDVMLALDTHEQITTIEQEMTMRALKRGYKVMEIPSHEYARKAGVSTISLRRVWVRYIYSFLKNII